MKTTELRVGNLLNYCGNTVTVMEILRNNNVELGYFTDSIGFFRPLDNEHIKPIPLTEEWLIKFGFSYMVDYTIQKNGFTICFEKQGSHLFCFLESIGLEIYYVHQLQNLYWCLCGEELKIEL